MLQLQSVTSGIHACCNNEYSSSEPVTVRSLSASGFHQLPLPKQTTSLCHSCSHGECSSSPPWILLQVVFEPANMGRVPYHCQITCLQSQPRPTLEFHHNLLLCSTSTIVPTGPLLQVSCLSWQRSCHTQSALSLSTCA